MKYLSPYKFTLDPKGRMFIPSRYREQIGEEVSILMSPDKCLFLYDNVVFEKVVDQVLASAVDRQSRIKARNFFRGSTTLSIDKQGRITIPQEFINFAKLENDLLLLGAGNKFEIWRADAPEVAPLDPDTLTDDSLPDIVY